MEEGPAESPAEAPPPQELSAALSYAAAHVDTPLLLLDFELRILYSNPALRQMMQVDDLSPGSALTEVFPRLRQSMLERFLRELTPDSGRRSMDAGLSNRFLATTAFTGDWGILVSFESVKRRDEIDRLHWELLDGIAHHLQTPLTSIRGYCETLQRGDDVDAETAEEFLHRIQTQSARLTELVDTVLYIARLRSMREPLSLIEMDMRHPVLEALSHCVHAIEARGHGLAISVSEEPMLVQADYQAIYDMACNLLENAVKYTPYGGEIELRMGIDYEFGEVSFSVLDNGIGIPPELCERVFDKFFRAQRENESVKGTGLGLAKVRSIAEAHGGRAFAQPNDPQGTVLTVILPLLLSNTT